MLFMVITFNAPGFGIHTHHVCDLWNTFYCAGYCEINESYALINITVPMLFSWRKGQGKNQLELKPKDVTAKLTIFLGFLSKRDISLYLLLSSVTGW
jgi:hypothetical protein